MNDYNGLSRPVRPEIELFEDGILGAMLTSAEGLAAGAFELTGAEFRDPRKEHVFTTAALMHIEGKPVTVATAFARLTAEKLAGGSRNLTMQFLLDLCDRACLVPQIGYYADQVAAEAEMRRRHARAQSREQAWRTSAPDDLAELEAREQAEDAEIRRRGRGAQERFPSLEWQAVFEADYSAVDYLPGKLMRRGEQCALVGAGKAGKSMLVLDWLLCCVTGRGFLGDDPRDALNVLCFDRENSQEEIYTRLVALGAKPADLARLDYRLFPSFSGTLDQSERASAELVAIVDNVHPDLVVFDTASRFIGGKENDSDTWLAWYRNVHMPLKERGIAAVRLDHMGKDEERGARGSSAKNQDVDHVWELCKDGEHTTAEAGVETVVTELRLNRTHSRSGRGSDLYRVTRRGRRGVNGGSWEPGGTSHSLAYFQGGTPAALAVERAARMLIEAGIPAGLGRDAVRDWAAGAGIPIPRKAADLAAITRSLKQAQG